MVKRVALSEIQIPASFLAHSPSQGKIDDRVKRYRRDGPDSMCVRLNRAGWLVDGYAWYVAAKQLGLETVMAKDDGPDTCILVKAKHPGSPKEYTWSMSERTMARLKDEGVELAPGLALAVPAKGRTCRVVVTGVSEGPWPSEHKEIFGVWIRKDITVSK